VTPLLGHTLEPPRRRLEEVGASPNCAGPGLEGLPLGIGDVAQRGRPQAQRLGSEVLHQAIADLVGDGAAARR
jgi:hypothetical protein